mgnify:CR=1 FL=1
MQFQLAKPLAIRGDQLMDEIWRATGLDLTARYSFMEPDLVVIDRGDVAADAKPDVLAAKDKIAATIAAHVPDPLYFPEDRERAAQMEIDAKATEARSLWDGYAALKDKTPTEIFTVMQMRMDTWASLADARRDLREWLPLMAALIAWGMRK